MVDLHTHVTCGVLALERVQLDTLQVAPIALCLRIGREVYLTLCELAEHLKTLLEVLLLACKNIVVVGCERSAIERRHKD